MNFDLADAIFWGVIVGYWVVAFLRLPVYWRRWLAEDPYPWERGSKHQYNSVAWTSLGVATVWPYYEAGRWVRDTLINRMTVEERKQKQVEDARKIIADWEAEQFRDL